MIEIDIPGFGRLRLECLVLDYNGTIAVDGQPVHGVKESLIALAQHVEIHVLTADTFGEVKKKLSDIPCKTHVLPVEAQNKGKMEFRHASCLCSKLWLSEGSYPTLANCIPGSGLNINPPSLS